MLRKLTSHSPEEVPEWTYKRHAFSKLRHIIDCLMQMCNAEVRATINHCSSVKPYTRGTGLLHWLASCPRHDLRDEALGYADKLTKDTSIAGDYHPDAGVNELFDLDHRKFGVFKYGDVNKRTRVRSTTTPLHTAILYNNREMVKLLLRRGADPEKVDGSGLTAYGLFRQLYPNDKYFDIMEGGRGVDLKEGEVPKYFDWYDEDDAKRQWVAGLEEHMEYLQWLDTVEIRDSETSEAIPEEQNAEASESESMDTGSSA
jgi:hypothetical protein